MFGNWQMHNFLIKSLSPKTQTSNTLSVADLSSSRAICVARPDLVSCNAAALSATVGTAAFELFTSLLPG